jgi:hypothetical protein
MSTATTISKRWSEQQDDDEDLTHQELVMEQRTIEKPEPTSVPPIQIDVLSGDWRVQGRRRDAIKKEAVRRPLLVFACLPWSPKLLFRGVVRGEEGLLELVQRKQYGKFHGYDPVGKQLVWYLKPQDQTVGVQKADAAYIQRVEQQFRAEVERARNLV